MEHFLTSGMHWQLINFAIFLAVLIVVLRKPVREFFAGRAAELGFQLKEAARLKAEAERRHRELEKRWREIALEAQRLRDELLREGEEERRAIVAEAAVAAEHLQKEAARIGRQEVQRAKERLRAEAAEWTVGLAARLLRESIGPQDQQRFTEAVVTQLRAEIQ